MFVSSQERQSQKRGSALISLFPAFAEAAQKGKEAEERKKEREREREREKKTGS